MATYTVIQDIEAEDKLLGPLSLRQFIYAMIVFALGGVGYMATKINVVLFLPFLPPMGFFGLLAAPFGRDQSSEVWLLAKIRFMFKPRKRIWDQSGLKNLVTITVPKKIEKHLTDGLDESQVRSRLTALANTLDSRGWAIKNVAASTFTPPAFAMSQPGSSDRLIATSMLPTSFVNDDTQVTDDILDEHNNPTAQKLSSLIAQSEQTRRQNLVATMQAAPAAAPTAPRPASPAAATTQPIQSDLWFTAQNTPPPPPPVATPAQSPIQATDEQRLLDHLRQDKAATAAANSHIKRIPTAEELAASEAKRSADALAAANRAKEIEQLARNDDLSIATIAHQAQKDTNQPKSLDDGEVVISLR